MALDSRAGLQTARTLAYVRRYGMREHPVLKRCRLETLKNRPDATIMTAPEVACFIGFFLECMGAQRGLEVGVFTGYSSLAIGLSLPEDGSLLACEADPTVLALATDYWRAAGIAGKVQGRLGDARRTLEELIVAGERGSFDFAYIDADKLGYDAYYEACLVLVRARGVIIVDNTLWGGRVADSANVEAETQALRAFNEKLAKDQRISLVQTTMGDGTTFARVR